MHMHMCTNCMQMHLDTMYVHVFNTIVLVTLHQAVLAVVVVLPLTLLCAVQYPGTHTIDGMHTQVQRRMCSGDDTG